MASASIVSPSASSMSSAASPSISVPATATTTATASLASNTLSSLSSNASPVMSGPGPAPAARSSRAAGGAPRKVRFADDSALDGPNRHYSSLGAPIPVHRELTPLRHDLGRRLISFSYSANPRWERVVYRAFQALAIVFAVGFAYFTAMGTLSLMWGGAGVFGSLEVSSRCSKGLGNTNTLAMLNAARDKFHQGELTFNEILGNYDLEEMRHIVDDDRVFQRTFRKFLESLDAQQVKVLGSPFFSELVRMNVISGEESSEIQRRGRLLGNDERIRNQFRQDQLWQKAAVAIGVRHQLDVRSARPAARSAPAAAAAAAPVAQAPADNIDVKGDK